MCLLQCSVKFLLAEYLVTYRPSTNFDGYEKRVRGRTDVTLYRLSSNTVYVISVYSIYENRQSLPINVSSQTLPSIGENLLEYLL